MRKVKNFARFYACLNGIQTVDRDDTKQMLVSQFTAGRTTSLKEMYADEYDAMCDSIDPKAQQRARVKEIMKKARSAVLRRMQQLGVDTTDWNKVDSFCIDNRIAGKKFYDLTVEELKAMIPKLIAIGKKPKSRKATTPEVSTSVISNKDVDLMMCFNNVNNQLIN